MSVRRTPQMNAQRFSQTISNHAVRVKWERANRCSCFDPYSGQPLETCKACEGTGYIYLPGVIEGDGIIVSGLVLTKEFNALGDWKMGDLIATIPFQLVRQPSVAVRYFDSNPLFPVGEWDKFTLMDAMFRSHESLTRGRARPGTPPETLRYEYVAQNDDGTLSVDYVLKANATTGAVTYYTQGTDYTMTGNVINWLAGKGPAPDEQYTVTYWHNPVYIVYNQLPQSRDGIEGQHMPRKVVLRYRNDL